MKKLFYLLPLSLLAAACSNDDTHSGSIDEHFRPLVSPAFTVTQAQSAFTGRLEVLPLKEGTPDYFGNYTGKPPKLGPFPGNYDIQSGTSNPDFKGVRLTLPIGTYDLLYWGQVKLPDTLITYPYVREPPLVVGNDFSQLTYQLQVAKDTLYWPAPDMVYARQNVRIGSEPIGVDLQRVVSGINITVSAQDGGAFDASIDTIRVLVSSIAFQLNAYTGLPQDQTKTVVVPLKFSPSRYSAYNAVTLFPSATNPPVTIVLQLQNGQIKTYNTNLNSRLTANNMRHLTIEIGTIYDTVETGNDFQVSNWTESDETIDV